MGTGANSTQRSQLVDTRHTRCVPHATVRGAQSRAVLDNLRGEDLTRYSRCYDKDHMLDAHPCSPTARFTTRWYLTDHLRTKSQHASRLQRVHVRNVVSRTER